MPPKIEQKDVALPRQGYEWAGPPLTENARSASDPASS